MITSWLAGVALAVGAQIVSAAPAAPSASTTPPPGPRLPVEIQLIGPEARRRDLLPGLQALLESDAGGAAPPSWSFRDDAGGADAAPEGAPRANRVVIDAMDPSSVRVVLDHGSNRVSVRAVPLPAAPEDRHWLAACEAVAQIVAATVRTLAAEPPPAPVEPPAPPVAPGPVVVRRQAPPPAPRGDAFGVALAGGAHTAPFALGGSSDESNWLGPSLTLSLRYDAAKAFIELRLTGERSQRSDLSLDLQTQFYAAALAAGRQFRAGSFAVSLGGTVGAIALRQSSAPESQSGEGAVAGTIPVKGAEQPGTTWSVGALAGPLARATWSVSPRWFLDLVVALPVVAKRLDGAGANGWQLGSYFQSLVGVGVRP